jgi:predicted Rossmann fold nucleotide-binding protein DprA/Smf involved in DNA uptake
VKICVVGSRSIDKPEVVFPIIDKFIREHGNKNPTLISGGAKGVDALTKLYANTQGFDFVEFIPYHILDKAVEFNPKFFFIRNRQMIDNADKVLAIWDEKSTGTLHAIRYSQKIGVPIMIIKVKP